MNQDDTGYQQALDEIAQLPFNWDTYGSPPVARDALEGADRFLRLSAAIDMPSPHIAPISGGWVHLEWEEGGKSLQFEIGTHGEYGYTLLRDGDVVIEGQHPRIEERQVADYMRWFLRSTRAIHPKC